MGRRIRWLAVVLVACFSLVLIQLVNIQFREASKLNADAANPRNQTNQYDNLRGDILAADGTVLAKSVKAPKGGPREYLRSYPLGSLFSQIVGYSDTFYGTGGVENEYDTYLKVHSQPAQTLTQALGFDPTPKSTDDVTLTIQPALQQAARTALSDIPSVNKDAAVIAIDPATGAIEADYSTPSFDPNLLSSPNLNTEQFWGTADFMKKDPEGFFPGVPLATGVRFFPGSTFKVITSTAVYDLRPDLADYSFPYAVSLKLPNSNIPLMNDGGSACGGMMTTMLPASCDPGYGQLGLLLGAQPLYQQATQFGYNTVPPIDLPYEENGAFGGVIASFFPQVSAISPPDQAFLAYSAIGQKDVQATALQNALVAAGIANGGVVMTPHVMAEISDNSGNVVKTYQPKVWMRATTAATAAQLTVLMHSVVTGGTATQVGFSPLLDAAVKTGTAQVQAPSGAETTDDWMIGFAPANNPRIAVAVVVPYQSFSATGAEIAGPIMKAMLTAALAASSTSSAVKP